MPKPPEAPVTPKAVESPRAHKWTVRALAALLPGNRRLHTVRTKGVDIFLTHTKNALHSDMLTLKLSVIRASPEIRLIDSNSGIAVQYAPTADFSRITKVFTIDAEQLAACPDLASALHKILTAHLHGSSTLLDKLTQRTATMPVGPEVPKIVPPPPALPSSKNRTLYVLYTEVTTCPECRKDAVHRQHFRVSSELLECRNGHTWRADRAGRLATITYPFSHAEALRDTDPTYLNTKTHGPGRSGEYKPAGVSFYNQHHPWLNQGGKHGSVYSSVRPKPTKLRPVQAQKIK